MKSEFAIDQERPENSCGLGVLAFALAFPTLLTWVYFVLLADGLPSVQQLAYTVGKVVQFGLPVVWLTWILRRKIRIRRPGPGLLHGAVFGLLAGAAIYVLYRWLLLPGGSLTGPIEAIRAKVTGIGIDSQIAFAVMGIGYSVFHSFLEEYYWRWFVFAELRRRTSTGVAITVSSLGFMAHHVIVLATFFGWDSPITYLISLGVALGGAVWAVLYHRTGSLYGAWLSHCLVDAAIFFVGFEMMRPYLG
ncbi:MAG: type II CAAX endopeptidase family protein [Planctomycetota bacterium]|nr:type II CAAX endopeptidase family protein [Planctomycetota bacterium]